MATQDYFDEPEVTGEYDLKEDSAPANAPFIAARLVPVRPVTSAIELVESAEVPHSFNSVEVGRAASIPQEYRVQDARISSVHARFYVESSESSLNVMVEDKSGNGVYVNGTRVGKGNTKQLQHGAEVTFVVPNTQHKDSPSVPCYVVTLFERTPASSPASSSIALDTPSSASTVTFDSQIKDEALLPAASSSSSAKKELDAASKAEQDGGPKKRQKLEEDAEAHQHASSSSAAASSSSSAAAAAADQQLSDNLTCGICADLFFKPVAVIPCLHSFCSPCLSAWIDSPNDSNSKCPGCRGDVESLRKDHRMSTLVDMYLTSHPDKQRSEDEIKDLEAANTLTDEKLAKYATKKKRRNHYDDDEYDSEYDSEYDEEDEEEAPCRECAAPSTVDGHQCHATNKNHVMCCLCYQPMPLRDPTSLPPERKQSCSFCHQHYCNAYFSAQGGCVAGAAAFLKKCGEHTVTSIPMQVFGGNTHERDLLLEWMGSKGLSAQDVWNQILLDVEANKYKMPLGLSPTREIMTCANCIGNIFSTLLLEFRIAIPDAELIDGMKKPKCWYGASCRTFRHNENHRKNFSHACKQTKF